MSKSEPQFKEQGGSSTMDPHLIRRWLISKVMTSLSSEKRMLVKRQRHEQKRRKDGRPHVVEYFHQFDDGYSHLAAQTLKPLLARYDIELRCHLVSQLDSPNVVEPALALRLGQYDAERIATHYGVHFPQQSKLPEYALIELAKSIMANQHGALWVGSIVEVGDALWEGNADALKSIAHRLGTKTKADSDAIVAEGNARRTYLQHYSGAMFYYEGEWYWGVDRLYHLEQRLQELGADNSPERPFVAQRPEIDCELKNIDSRLTLEFYASLRSPYTAVIFDRVLQLSKDSGINLVLRPVLPMVMRGVPASTEKGRYIMFDAAREARAAKVNYGNIRDPIGQPVRHAYALYQWACSMGKGNELLSSFLRAAFADGINTNKASGLRYVVEKAELDWAEGKRRLEDTSWQNMVETNRLAMYESGLWGVPSFRLLDEQEKEVLSVWGQDRLWLVAYEIKRLSGA